MTIPPGWASLLSPGDTSKLPENSPRRTASLCGALCSPLMALLDNCPSSLQRLWAFVHLFAHPSLAVSHTLWQKETLKHREAEAVSAAG